jgi:hypothetical protein
MVTRWFRFNPPMNEKHLIGIRHILERLPSQTIWADATAELDETLAATAKTKSEREAKHAVERAATNLWAVGKVRTA